MSKSKGWSLLMFRIRVLSRVGILPSVVVTFKFIISFPNVAPLINSKSAAYRKKNKP